MLGNIFLAFSIIKHADLLSSKTEHISVTRIIDFHPPEAFVQFCATEMSSDETNLEKNFTHHPEHSAFAMLRSCFHFILFAGFDEKFP